jgi:hypothetical protein
MKKGKKSPGGREPLRKRFSWQPVVVVGFMVFSVEKTMKTTIIRPAFGVCRVKNRLSGDFSRFYARRRNKLLHSAFFDAIRLELAAWQDVLDFQAEHPLNREPLRIDVLIIKKINNLAINKNIAAIFRRENILEFKSPDDSLSVADFHKVLAYAHLYSCRRGLIPRPSGRS